MSRYIVARANTLVFGGIVAILLMIGAVSWDRSNAARSARQWSQHTYEVIDVIRELAIAVQAGESGQRGFLLTGDDDDLAPYQAARGRIAPLLGRLQLLTADNGAQQDRLRRLAPILQNRLEDLAQAIRARRAGGFDAALRMMRPGAGKDLIRQIEATLEAMTAEENRLLAQRHAAIDRRGAWVRGLVAAGAMLAIGALLWAAGTLNRAWSRSRKAEAEQRALALRLRTSLDSLSQGVAVFGPDKQLMHWNDCFRTLLDLPAATVRARAPYAAFAERIADGSEVAPDIEQRTSDGPCLSGQAITSERARPGGRHLELRRTPMPGGGFVLTVTDMTNHVQAEAVLREAQKMQAIGQLTGGIAHDFNNLLTVILGNLELAHGWLGSEHPLRARIERATWAAQRGAALTGQLLAFARKQPLAPVPVNLTATVQGMIPLLQRTIGEHIEVRYAAAAGSWPAMADAAQLENALLNLALNARDAMPGGGRLTIELANKVLDETYAATHLEVAPGDYAMLAVSDTGHGMAPDVLARVFEPFFTTKPEGEGTGLGLAMVFGFAKQSGGHVNVYSEPGEGTTVRLYLPRALTPGVAPKAADALRADPPRGSATVLVVEDEAAVREVITTILGDLGYRVLEAADGEEGLRVFGAHAGDIDLVLTDIVLPGKVRGRALADCILAIRPEVRVLFMSGYAENAIVHQGRLDDGVQLIGKPFKREQLACKVAEVLQAPATAAADSPDAFDVVEL